MHIQSGSSDTRIYAASEVELFEIKTIMLGSC
jgi:hypothetical protein